MWRETPQAESGATAGKLDIAKRAKELGYDAIHDTVHEMAKDEARHGKGFEGLLKRYSISRNLYTGIFKTSLIRNKVLIEGQK